MWHLNVRGGQHSMEGVGAALVKAVSRDGHGSRPATYIRYRSRGPTITAPVHRREEQVQRYNGKAGRPVLPSLRSSMGDVSHVRQLRQKQPSSLIACRAYYRFLPKSEPFTAIGVADTPRSRGRSEVTLCRTHGMILAVGYHGRHLYLCPAATTPASDHGRERANAWSGRPFLLASTPERRSREKVSSHRKCCR